MIMNHRHLFIPLLLAALIAGNQALAQSHAEGRKAYINGDYQTAYEIFKPLAEEGDAEAQKMLAIMYDYGHGVEQDKTEALEWYLKSAEQGEPAVQYQVGSKYFRGDGVDKDYTEAAMWWEKAAGNGQADAQFNLGLMYFRGLSLEQNDGRAAELFKAAAEQDHAQAQYSLAVMHAFGRGVEKSYPQALNWFNKAAEQGVAQAQFNLGVFYENGYGVEADTAEAKRWYERAASQGLAEAETRLANLETGTDSASGKTMAASAGNPGGAAAAPSETASTEKASTMDTGSSGIRREDWVLQQPDDNYTLQIGSVTREKAMIDFIRDNGLESEAAYIEVVIDGVTRYNGLYGHFGNYEEAQKAAEELSASIGVKPWIRNFGLLQKMIR